MKKPTAKEKYERAVFARKAISEMLIGGAVPLKSIRIRLKTLGISDREAQKARQALRVKTFLRGGEGYWEIPKPGPLPSQVYRSWRG